MAILTSLFSGVSGLNAFGAGLSVVSDNIANMNTMGFKEGDVSFADIISSGLGRRQIGRGVFVNDIRTDFSQGSFETTGNGLDLSIEGEGFYIMKDSVGSEFYTRNGAFNTSELGFVENPEGLLLQGIQANRTGVLTGQSGPINLSPTTFPPLATAKLDIVANLDSRATAISGGFVLATPAASSNFSTSITLYDSLGNGHLVSVYFTKTAASNWAYNVVVDAKDATSGSATIATNGTLVFGTNGTLTTPAVVGAPDFDFAGGATQNQAVTLGFGTGTSSGGTGTDGVTQYGSNSAVLTQTQNGFASGALSSFAIDQDGLVTGLFTNGESRTLAQISLAKFSNKQAMTKVGDNLFTRSSDSGQPIVGLPNSAGTGRILSNALEMSNVDLAQQFVKMIEYQRGFQANSRVITTTDDLLQELVNLKR